MTHSHETQMEHGLSPSAMFCRQCGYQLMGLSENRCPECGRPFDPADRRTYLSHPKGWLLRRWLRRVWHVFLALLLIASVPAARIGWLYWSWRSDQPLVAAIRQAGGEPHWLWLNSYFEPFLPVDPRSGSGTHHPYMLERPIGFHFLNRKNTKGFNANDALARMPNHPQLRIVMLNDTDISDEGLRVLKDWPQVQDLSLGKQITDAGLAQIVDMPNLEVLGLSQTRVSDAGLANLRNLKRLRKFFPPLTVTDAGMQHVAQLPALQEIWLNSTAITDEGVAVLSKAATLKAIHLAETKISDAGLAHLRNLGRLAELRLDGTKVTDAGMAALAQIQSLKVIYLRRTGITDAGLSQLTKLPALWFVDVGQTSVTPATVASLKQSRPGLQIVGP